MEDPAQNISGVPVLPAEEQIRCAFDDNEEIILLISSEKPMLLLLIRIKAILMSTHKGHNVGFY